MRVVFRAGALTDYRGAVNWYKIRSPAAADKFRQSVKRATDRLAEFPLSAPALFEDFRGCLIRGFPYQLVYRAEADVIRTYAVFHCSQNPVQVRRLVDDA